MVTIWLDPYDDSAPPAVASGALRGEVLQPVPDAEPAGPLNAQGAAIGPTVALSPAT